MGRTSLSKKLTFIITAIVIISGIIISLLVIQRYKKSLLQVARAQADNIAHSLALEAADIVLVNDRMALQKLLDNRKKSNQAVSYIFIVNQGQIPAHTFEGGVPLELIKTNQLKEKFKGHIKKIISQDGSRYIDVAWPIFEGKAGVLRLGFSEKPYMEKAFRLWYDMCLIILGILIISLLVAHIFIRRITRPLQDLTKTVEKIDHGDSEVSISTAGDGEVGLLSVSFSNMLQRIHTSTQKLKDKNIELERSYRQTRTSFEIAKETGSLIWLDEISTYLIQKLQDIVTCRKIIMLVFSGNRQFLFIHSANHNHKFEGKVIETFENYLGNIQHHDSQEKNSFPLDITEFDSAKKITSFPLRHKENILGAICIGCPGDCKCVIKELEVVELIMNQVTSSIIRAVSYGDEIRDLKQQKTMTTGFSGILGKAPQMQLVYRLIKDVCDSDATVLIQGESGTGKELVARAIHDNSPRKDKPFIVINCSAYPATLLESELFGHEKGSFTGADQQKQGRFEQAEQGTVFLDEIGEIDLSAQVKLLRVLQTKKFERIGGSTSLDVNARILVATNRDLLQQVKTGLFREDLFYRINVIPITLPPLRKRRNDIPLLARHFLVFFAERENKTINQFTSNAMRVLLDHFWPGNVRELENSIEHAVVLAKDQYIHFSDLPFAIQQSDSKKQNTASSKQIQLKDIEKQHLIEALEANNWNKKSAAKALGIGRSTIYVKLKKYNISSPS